MTLFQKMMAACTKARQDTHDYPELIQAKDLMDLDDGTFVIAADALDVGSLTEATLQPVEFASGEVEVLLVREVRAYHAGQVNTGENFVASPARAHCCGSESGINTTVH